MLDQTKPNNVNIWDVSHITVVTNVQPLSDSGQQIPAVVDPVTWLSSKYNNQANRSSTTCVWLWTQNAAYANAVAETIKSHVNITKARCIRTHVMHNTQTGH